VSIADAVAGFNRNVQPLMTCVKIVAVNSDARPAASRLARVSWDVSAFLRTPREVFVPNARKGVAYSELEITTSPGRALWTPRDTAKLIKLAAIQPSDVVLVVGAGAGYEAALISQLADTVIALEETAALVDAMSQRFAAIGIDRAAPVEGPLAKGLPEQAPFDVIYIAGMIEVLPDSWAGQLRDGGRLVAVMAQPGGMGRGKVFTKAGNTVSAREGFDCCPPRFTAFDRKPSFSF
jgi:protein-L-isoaspartate(D-aspartate) O-methyltransferase